MTREGNNLDAAMVSPNSSEIVSAEAVAVDGPQTLKITTVEDNSYGLILKSSALIGSSSVLNILISIVRTKAMAVLLGPAGFGLMGIFTAIADLVRSIAAMGINQSGVRQIAAAVGTSDTEHIARTVTVLRRVTVLLGVLGAALMVVLSLPLSELSFGNHERAGAIALLSLAVLFKLVADGQTALLQGMRRISDLAKIGVLGALYGTMLSIPLVYFLREDGVALSVVSIAGCALITSWWYSRKVKIDAPAMNRTEVRQEAGALLKMGVVFMASGLMMLGAAYAVRTMLLRMDGLDAAGFYQAAWTLGGLYVGIILQAMGADFYPRLTEVAADNGRVNRLVNEQAHISLLLAGPGVIATLTFAPLLMVLFYSSEFAAGSELLQLLCLGMALRIVSWPIGYIIVAKGERVLFFLTELAWTSVNLGLAYLLISYCGLEGAGIAFFFSYVVHALLIYAVVRKISGFRWSAENIQLMALFVGSITFVFLSFWTLTPSLALWIGIAATIVSSLFSARMLLTFVPHGTCPSPLRKVLRYVRLTEQGDR